MDEPETPPDFEEPRDCPHESGSICLACGHHIPERRAGLSPIARTEIERVRDEMRARVPASLDPDLSKHYIPTEALAPWLAALDTVLGSASTKEAGNG